MSAPTSARDYGVGLDGKPRPGVTAVIKRGFGGFQNEAMAAAAERGTRVHELVAGVGWDPARSGELEVFGGGAEERCAGRVLRALPGLQPMAVEAPLVDARPGRDFGGTPDCVGILDGRRTLIDLKTGSSLYEEHVLQLAGYAGLWGLYQPGVERVLLVHAPIGVDVVDLVEIRAPEMLVAATAFEGALTMYRARPVLRTALRAPTAAAAA